MPETYTKSQHQITLENFSSQKFLILIIKQFEGFLHQSTATKLVNIDLVSYIFYVAGLGVHQLDPLAYQPIIKLEKVDFE